MSLETVRRGFPRSIMRFVVTGSTDDGASRPGSKPLYVSSEFQSVLGNTPAFSNEEAVNALRELIAALSRDGWQPLDIENLDRENWWRQRFARQSPLAASAEAPSQSDACFALLKEFSAAKTIDDEIRVLFRQQHLLKSKDFYRWLVAFALECASEPEDEPGRYPNAGLFNALHKRLVAISVIDLEILRSAIAAEYGLRKLAPNEGSAEVYANVLSAVLSPRTSLEVGEKLLVAHREMVAEAGWLPWLNAALDRANDPTAASFLAEAALRCSRMGDAVFGSTAELARTWAVTRTP